MRKLKLRVYVKICSIFYRRLYKYIKVNDNFIIAESFLGSDKSDNILPLLMELENDYTIFYIKKPSQKFKIRDYKMVNRLSFKYFYLIAKSKYVLTNSRFPNFYLKNKDQVYIQTWHGTPLKRLVHDMVDFNIPNQTKKTYLYNFDNEVSRWDYLLSPSTYSTKCFKSAFRYQGEIIEIGYPRNVELYNSNTEDIKLIKENLNINLTKEIILFTPTYRENNYSDGRYQNNIDLDLKILSKDKNRVYLIRKHYLVSEKIDFSNYDNIVDVSSYSNINDLYKISDVLINDYSSTMFDYSILRKPVLLFIPDIEVYENNLRGFYTPIKNLGLKMCYTTTEVIEALNNGVETSLVSDEFNNIIPNNNFIVKKVFK